jgi:hypothetical protein
VQPTCTPRAGPFVRSVQSWASRRPLWASASSRRGHHASRRSRSSRLHTADSGAACDQGLNWTEVAEQTGMTVSGASSRCRRPGHDDWPMAAFLADAIDQSLAIGVRAAALIISVEPPSGLSSTPGNEAHSFAVVLVDDDAVFDLAHRANHDLGRCSSPRSPRPAGRSCDHAVVASSRQCHS